VNASTAWPLTRCAPTRRMRRMAALEAPCCAVYGGPPFPSLGRPVTTVPPVEPAADARVPKAEREERRRLQRTQMRARHLALKTRQGETIK